MKLKTLVSLLSLMGIMFVFYMGHYYKMLGDVAGSLFLTLVVFALMAGILWIATAARQRQGSFSEILHIVGIAVGVVYIAVGALYIVPEGSHFFYVMGETNNMQIEVDTVISQTDKMFAEYESRAEDRALHLKQKIDNSRYSLTGKEDFEKAYPKKNWSYSFATTEEEIFLGQLYRNLKPEKVEWKGIKEECQLYIVDNWELFMSPVNVKILDEKVKEYGRVLKKDYEGIKSPYERLYGENPTFNQQVSAQAIVDKIQGSDTDGVWNIILFLILIVSASAFIFVQSSHIKKQKKDDPIYEQGYDL